MYVCGLDISGLQRATAETKAELERSLARAAQTAATEGADEAKRGNFKDRTGELRRSIRPERVVAAARGARWKIVAARPYAMFVEGGTRAHEIWPKAANRLVGPLRPSQTRRATGPGPHEHIVGRGLALRWKAGGTIHFARMVHHPGSKEHPFMGPAALKAERVLYREGDTMIIRLGKIWVTGG